MQLFVSFSRNIFIFVPKGFLFNLLTIKKKRIMKFKYLFLLGLMIVSSANMYAEETVLDKLMKLPDYWYKTLQFKADKTNRLVCGLDAGTGNMFCSPSNVFSNKSDCSDPEFSTSWTLTKYSASSDSSEPNGEKIYFIIRSVANMKCLTNYYTGDYIHPEENKPCKYYVEAVSGDTTNTKAYLYCYRLDNEETDTNGVKKKWYLGEEVHDGWESNPMKFFDTPSFNCSFEFDEAPKRAQDEAYTKLSQITGIETVDADSQVPAWRKGIYDVYGRKVKNPVNGTFYIIDGKKVIYRGE